MLRLPSQTSTDLFLQDRYRPSPPENVFVVKLSLFSFTLDDHSSSETVLFNISSPRFAENTYVDLRLGTKCFSFLTATKVHTLKKRN